MKNSCPFKIVEENEIGTIIQSDKMIWKNVCHVKVHLVKSKINLNNKRPDKNYLFTVFSCYGVTETAIPGFIHCSSELNCLTSLLHSSKLMTNRKVISSKVLEKKIMFDVNTMQHSFFQDFLTQNLSQYSQSHET